MVGMGPGGGDDMVAEIAIFDHLCREKSETFPPVFLGAHIYGQIYLVNFGQQLWGSGGRWGWWGCEKLWEPRMSENNVVP
jgi:hypothetical protein